MTRKKKKDSKENKLYICPYVYKDDWFQDL